MIGHFLHLNTPSLEDVSWFWWSFWCLPGKLNFLGYMQKRRKIDSKGKSMEKPQFKIISLTMLPSILVPRYLNFSCSGTLQNFASIDVNKRCDLT